MEQKSNLFSQDLFDQASASESTSQGSEKSQKSKEYNEILDILKGNGDLAIIVDTKTVTPDILLKLSSEISQDISESLSNVAITNSGVTEGWIRCRPETSTWGILNTSKVIEGVRALICSFGVNSGWAFEAFQQKRKEVGTIYCTNSRSGKYHSVIYSLRLHLGKSIPIYYATFMSGTIHLSKDIEIFDQVSPQDIDYVNKLNLHSFSPDIIHALTMYETQTQSELLSKIKSGKDIALIPMSSKIKPDHYLHLNQFISEALDIEFAPVMMSDSFSHSNMGWRYDSPYKSHILSEDASRIMVCVKSWNIFNILQGIHNDRTHKGWIYCSPSPSVKSLPAFVDEDSQYLVYMHKDGTIAFAKSEESIEESLYWISILEFIESGGVFVSPYQNDVDVRGDALMNKLKEITNYEISRKFVQTERDFLAAIENDSGTMISYKCDLEGFFYGIRQKLPKAVRIV